LIASQLLLRCGSPCITSALTFDLPWHHRYVTSTRLERLARAAYEAHRSAHLGSLPAWEDTTEQEQQAWRAAVSAVAGQTKKTVAEAAPTKSLLIQVGDQSYDFHTEFIAGRQGTLVISDEFASNHHARFTTAHGLWYVEDLGSTNGTWLNRRRIHAAQRLKKGDRIWIGHTIMTVLST
jgi:pSer/pThr/pTyr-binding forkhead associated (FHA) protein